MADRDFDFIENLVKAVKGEVAEVLSKEVFEEIKKVELEHVTTDVWDTYPERKYVWRESDGIDDPDNITIEKRYVDGDEIGIVVVNDTIAVR